jgi:hypothetical protein
MVSAILPVIFVTGVIHRELVSQNILLSQGRSGMSQDVAEKIDLVVPKEYGAFLKEIKEKILSSQVKAALAVNRELIALY